LTLKCGVPFPTKGVYRAAAGKLAPAKQLVNKQRQRVLITAVTVDKGFYMGDIQ
jgi:hypothetical protein